MKHKMHLNSGQTQHRAAGEHERLRDLLRSPSHYAKHIGMARRVFFSPPGLEEASSCLPLGEFSRDGLLAAIPGPYPLATWHA